MAGHAASPSNVRDTQLTISGGEVEFGWASPPVTSTQEAFS